MKNSSRKKIKRIRKRMNEKPKKKPREHVFSHTVDQAAIIDKIVLSANGKLNETFRESALRNVDSKSILHPGGHYAACIFGNQRLTGNPVSIHHGKAINFENIPNALFTAHSENIPLTGAQVQLLVEACMADSTDIGVSSLELSFDFTGETFEQIKNNLIHRAHRVVVLTDERGWQTLYVGSPRSSWQIRIYQKTDSALRLEFILRRGFLKRCGINRPQDVLTLRKLNVWRLLCVRRFSRTSAKRITRRWKDSAERRAVMNWSDTGRSRKKLLRILKANKTPARLIFRRTSLQKRLEAMQRRLIW